MPGIGSAGGAVAGKIVGEILGTIITTVACSTVITIFESVKHMEDYKLTESQVRRIEQDALKEMKVQREKFHNIVQQEFDIWDKNVEDGFNIMMSSACKGMFDTNGITEGLDKVLSVFGKSVKFKSIDEYEKQLDMPLKLSF